PGPGADRDADRRPGDGHPAAGPDHRWPPLPGGLAAGHVRDPDRPGRQRLRDRRDQAQHHPGDAELRQCVRARARLLRHHAARVHRLPRRRAGGLPGGRGVRHLWCEVAVQPADRTGRLSALLLTSAAGSPTRGARPLAYAPMSENTPEGERPAEESAPPPLPGDLGQPGSGAAGPPPGAAPVGPPPGPVVPPPPAGPPAGGYGGPPNQASSGFGPPPQGPPGGFGGPPPPSPPGGFGGPPPQGRPGGFGGPPPHSGPGGYAPLPPTAQATDGFVWGWNAFKANAGTLILGQLAWLVIVLTIVGLWFGLLSGSGILASATGSQAAAGAFLGVGILGVLLLVVVVVLVSIFASAGMSNATLKLVRGESISV